MAKNKSGKPASQREVRITIDDASQHMLGMIEELTEKFNKISAVTKQLSDDVARIMETMKHDGEN